jgi:hypothetical protein
LWRHAQPHFYELIEFLQAFAKEYLIPGAREAEEISLHSSEELLGVSGVTRALANDKKPLK